MLHQHKTTILGAAGAIAVAALMIAAFTTDLWMDPRPGKVSKWENLIVKPYRHIVVYDGLEDQVVTMISGQCQAVRTRNWEPTYRRFDVTCQTGPKTYVTDHLVLNSHANLIVHTGVLTEENKWTKVVTYPHDKLTFPLVTSKRN